MGNIFDIYDYAKNQTTNRNLTIDPTIRVGTIRVITLTENFSTALVMSTKNPITLGMVAITKDASKVALKDKLRYKRLKDEAAEKAAIDEMDVELNIADINKDMLNKNMNVKLTDDELAALELEEKKKSVIDDEERDIMDIEKLEKEIVRAEDTIKDAKLDEDKFLEQQSLEKIEKSVTGSADKFSPINEIEDEIGKKFMDENLNSRENPYGLTEFDLEEVDELLNSAKL